MLRDSFSDTEIIDGHPTTKLYEKHRRPSFSQFRYHCHTKRDRISVNESRKGKRRARQDRAIVGNVTDRASGAMSEVVGDWTYAHHLRSSYNPAIVLGRCIILFLICSLTRMVVGFHVGFRENWESVMLAVENMAMSKVDVCAKYGITIEEREWPCKGLPGRALIDGGKFDVHNASGLVRMGTEIETAIPYMADIKAIGERLNETIKRKVSSFLKDTHRRHTEDKDPSTNAFIDINTYILIIIITILEYHKEIIERYPLSKDQDQNNVVAAPIRLWEYAVANLGGPRNVDLNILRLNLLPSGTARVNASGIHFDGLTYMCDLAEKERWREIAALKKRKCYDIDIKFHPGLVDFIYIYESGNLKAVCELHGRNSIKYKGYSWYEVHKQREHYGILVDSYNDERDEQQEYASSTDTISYYVEKAQQETASLRAGMSKRAITERGEKLRESEANERSRQEAWRSEEIVANNSSNEVQQQEELVDQDVHFPHNEKSTLTPPRLSKRDLALQKAQEKEQARDES